MNTMNVTEFLRQERKLPFLTKEQAQQITKVFQTPFHIYSEQYIREIVRLVYQAFSWNRGYREYFAVKANPNYEILRILFEEGCGFDCSSEAELLLAYAVGARGPQIMFTSNDTPPREFELAAKLGAIITLDDITHIDVLAEAVRRAGCRLPEVVALRWNPGGTFQASNDIMDTPGEAKYGMTTKQLHSAVKQLKKLGVKRIGLHAFLASNTLGEEYYEALSARLFQQVNDLLQHNVTIEFVNLSGGVGIAYRPDQRPNDILKIGELVQTNYRNILHKENQPRIYTEMGRFITGPFGGLVTKVQHIKNTHRMYVGVDASASDLMRPAIYGAYHHITVIGKESDPIAGTAYDITGPLCENNDKFAIQRNNLPKIVKGDLLFIHDTGAHGFAMGYNYNGRLKHAELLLCENGEVRLIRRAESIEDYFRTMMVSDRLQNALKDSDLILLDKPADFNLEQPVFCLGDIYTYNLKPEPGPLGSGFGDRLM